MFNIQFLSDPELFSEKTELYLRVREREGRILTENQVAHLPRFVPATENQVSLLREWRMRTHSFQRFQTYLKHTFADRPLRILDLGCGNGWLALNLAQRPRTELWAVDVNLPELEQGARVATASGLSNVQFVFADILQNTIPENKFDLIVLAASVQYFPDLSELFRALKRVLKLGGEIHILDSPFYKTEVKRQEAQTGTQAYYTKLDIPEMAKWYYHHCWQTIIELGGKNRNEGLWPKLLQRLRWLPPFPWFIFQ